jgi:histidine triad (HIT) family protein
LDAFPSVYGHTLVVPKKPYKNIYEIPDNLDDKLFKTVKKMAKTIKKALDADGINIVMNNESAAGQIVFHAHIHILPRFENDNGYQGERLTYPEGKAKEIADKIIACL